MSSATVMHKPAAQQHASDAMPHAVGDEKIRIRDLHAFYGESHILHGIDLYVNQGELVTLLGRNGAGRSTTLRSIMNMVGRRTGSIMINGRETIGMPAHQIAYLGLGFCPEERGIFASLNVEENLMLPPDVRSDGMPLDEIYSIFPNLYERRFSQGTRLSGGEQQMLALARIMRTGANILLLDEITEGLAPVIVKKLGEVLVQLKNRGLTILLVEQNFHFAAPIADRHYVMDHGHIVEEVLKDELADKQEFLNSMLGV
jgi:branched-chain amino acid transport system ATP-binding protein